MLQPDPCGQTAEARQDTAAAVPRQDTAVPVSKQDMATVALTRQDTGANAFSRDTAAAVRRQDIAVAASREDTVAAAPRQNRTAAAPDQAQDNIDTTPVPSRSLWALLLRAIRHLPLLASARAALALVWRPPSWLQAWFQQASLGPP